VNNEATFKEINIVVQIFILTEAYIIQNCYLCNFWHVVSSSINLCKNVANVYNTVFLDNTMILRGKSFLCRPNFE